MTTTTQTQPATRRPLTPMYAARKAAAAAKKSEAAG